MSLANLDNDADVAIVKSKAAFFRAARHYSKETSLMFVTDKVGLNDSNGYPLMVFFHKDMDNGIFDIDEISLSEVLKLF
jgi:hypothetical protein